MIEIT